MKVTLEQPAKPKASWLHVLWAGPDKELEGADYRPKRQDRAEQDGAEAETIWAGRTPAMRRSARVAA